MSGLQAIEEYNKALTSIYEDRKKKLEEYQSKAIDHLRSNYKDFMNENDRNKSTLNRAIGAMETLKSKADKLFQDGFTIINDTINIDNEIITELNKSRIGTFQGISRQTVINEIERKKKEREENEKNGIYNEPEQDNDDVAQVVLEQPYDERADINRKENTGGRKRKRKTNKKNIKKYKKSRKNKYKY
jgi:hypothetical protein